MIRKHRRHLESTILNYLNVLFYLLKNAYKSRYFFNGKYYSEYKRMHRKPKKKKKRGNEQITGWSLLNSLFFFQNVTAWSLLQYLRTEDDNYECKNRRPHVENN